MFSSGTCPVVYPQIYKEQLNTRVVLVAVETWTEKDQIDITINPVQMLYEFSKYRQRIKQHADVVHLISYVLVPTVTAVSTRVSLYLRTVSGSSDFCSVAAGPLLCSERWNSRAGTLWFCGH